MPVVTLLLSYLAKQVNSIVQVIFGWSITALFGKLRRRQQILITIALVLSLAWPLFVLGAFLPAVSAWAIAFIPLHKWLGDTVLRIVWITLAVLAPIGVGILVHVAAPQRRGGYGRAALTGYPTALGFVASFLVVLVTVPILKVASIVRRWNDEHVYVQPHDGDYDAVLHELADAVERAGMHATISKVPEHMVLATTIMRALARGTVAPFVSETLQQVTAPGIEIYLYPADLAIRGEPKKVARVRAMLGRTDLDAHAYLVASPDAQHVQDKLGRITKAPSRSAGKDLASAYHEIMKLDLPFDELETLDVMARRVERRLLRDGLVIGTALPIDGAQQVAGAINAEPSPTSSYR